MGSISSTWKVCIAQEKLEKSWSVHGTRIVSSQEHLQSHRHPNPAKPLILLLRLAAMVPIRRSPGLIEEIQFHNYVWKKAVEVEKRRRALMGMGTTRSFVYPTNSGESLVSLQGQSFSLRRKRLQKIRI